MKRRGGNAGVLTKVFKILEVMRDNPAGSPLKIITQATGLNKATVYRLLTQLEGAGYVFRDGSRLYTSGLKLTQFSHPTDFRSKLRDAARPALEGLWKGTQETINLGVLDEGAVLYIDVIQSPHVFRLASGVGMRRPVYATALGKALAAFSAEDQREELLRSLTFVSYTPHTITDLITFRKELEGVTRLRFALDHQESVVGARCVAAPVLSSEGTAVAAISIAGPVTRIGLDKIKLFAATEAARGISGRLYGKHSEVVLRTR